jgi:putative ATPase
VILAGEDIGLADPMGLVVATSAIQAFEFIGLPEGIFPIVEATLYLATAPKSNTATHYFKAFQLIEDQGKVEVPDPIKDANRDAVALGHGKGYKYPHDHPEHFLPQQYLPREILGTYFYNPSSQGYEAQVADRLERWRAAQRKALNIKQTEMLPDMSEDEISEVKQKHKASR